MNLLHTIERLVTCESPSTDLAAVARSADVTAEVGSALLGASPERIVLDGRTHLRWRLGSGPRKVLLLGHHDTVWPIGSLARLPFEVRDGVLRGPGCFDMKTGLAMIFHAVASLDSPDGVTVLVTGDEEIGSPSSRGLIEEEARQHTAVLVTEGSADGGALKTERKGTSMYEVTLHGRAAHAGLEPERGVSATVEAAHQVLAVSELTDLAVGTTVTPTVLSAGTTMNTVAALAKFMVDVRVRNLAEQLRVDEAMRALVPVVDGAKIEVTGGPNRAPMELSMSAGLFELASGIAAGLGMQLTSAAVGGASDGNFTAGVGIPTLDGLGAVGGGAHAESEHVLVSELVPRTTLLAALVKELLA
ncbi:M20 family metallopeptidase [Lentzea kentuckyensis]|uniref:M20 family metallopeptidase n=1 Tax=Lentzea kentuckyensis TaxID=360086 RepID=UPI000A386E67|nr:M20 family metallopeptidase [Lentzea kentuckyensis]